MARPFPASRRETVQEGSPAPREKGKVKDSRLLAFPVSTEALHSFPVQNPSFPSDRFPWICSVNIYIKINLRAELTHPEQRALREEAQAERGQSPVPSAAGQARHPPLGPHFHPASLGPADEGFPASVHAHTQLQDQHCQDPNIQCPPILHAPQGSYPAPGVFLWWRSHSWAQETFSWACASHVAAVPPRLITFYPNDPINFSNLFGASSIPAPNIRYTEDKPQEVKYLTLLINWLSSPPPHLPEATQDLIHMSCLWLLHGSPKGSRPGTQTLEGYLAVRASVDLMSLGK